MWGRLCWIPTLGPTKIILIRNTNVSIKIIKYCIFAHKRAFVWVRVGMGAGGLTTAVVFLRFDIWHMNNFVKLKDHHKHDCACV